jgi:hypothetical protein
MQLDDSIGELLARQQFQTDVSMAWREQGNTVANHLRDHMDASNCWSTIDAFIGLAEFILLEQRY